MTQRETSSQQGSPRASSDVAAKLKTYGKDIDCWPESWAGFPNLDVPVGERIVAEFTLFLLALISERRTQKTVNKYADYLWVLGGEIIRRTHFEERDRRLSGRALLLKYLHAQGGPLWNDARYEREHEAYDAVCARLYQFLTGGIEP
ncbi:hypothetical protein B1B_01325 [mine drainage metagenome]|uniref:Uncharacterized protein n=1 Tax=mine drainage metagenome TaxID=410659 RepID=T1C4P1_9ZZZZ